MNQSYPSNSDIADTLERIADLLEAQDANRYRVGAYRRAARVVASLDRPAADMAVSGEDRQLEDLPDIGKSIAGAIREFVHTGRSGLLERLEGQITPEDLFTTVPGIGEKLAQRIHVELDIDTLEELELAAHDGRLAGISGIGNRRIRAIRDAVGGILDRSTRRRVRRLRRVEKALESTDTNLLPAEPSVEVVLEVDREYRQKDADGRLKTIAPRRFNPDGKSWLPILHTEREGWHFTALFSNTARAHELNKTRDWVVVYFERDGSENQCTVVTEQHGPLQGRRVVRGREKQCLDYYGKLNENNWKAGKLEG
jgi:hypothetical protein